MLITRTPLRISLAGGGTDFPSFYKVEEGRVVSVAIDKYIYVIVKERCDSLIAISYSQRETVNSIDDLRHDLIRETLRKTGIVKGIEIHTLADIRSRGSGLGSSSSLTVGLLNALYLYQGIQITAKRLAQEACEIEIEKCGKPIGKQDQYIAAYGGIRSFSFLESGDVKVEEIQISEKDKRELENNLLLFYTGIDRKSETILEEQQQNIPNQISNLIILKNFADSVFSVINSREFNRLGLILGRTWEFKKKLATGISNSILDEMYNKAIQVGAKGGKICGAGGGGHLLLYVIPENQAAIRSALNEFQEVPFVFERFGSKAIFNVQGNSIK